MGKKAYTPKSAIRRAKTTSGKVINGARTKRGFKVRTSCTFYRPRTLKLQRNPKYQRKSTPGPNKIHIKMAVKKMYKIKLVKVNTLIRPDGLKKAFVRLTSDQEAIEVANKIGII